ncbi:hypothetical protein CYMTET_49362 [Cymbomonas tetramitiformis]|uniref:Uncharacterized protein n=1 Tax=Cymbomonas tetramitiformis TaxID=36881 RepID=A0AAE0BRG8_9CHLO|nr:hypothetical protein CYMTET_49362 [Cymbomonas tetramitiformis]
MDTQVILPLVNLTPPKNPRCVRKMDPMVCLTTEIFGPELVCGWLEPRSSQNEEQRVAASAERPERFEDLLATQSPLSQEEPDSSAPGPSAPQGAVQSLQREAMMWTCPMNRGRRSQLPQLSTDFLEESRRALANSNLVPWVGCRVKPWDNSFDVSSCRYTWKNQRLYRDKTNVAQLCHILRADSTSTEAPSLDHVRVEFARCGKQMWVLESQLRWPDWLGIDQKMSQYITEDGTWGFMGDYTTYVPPTGKEVVMPKYLGFTVDNSKLKRLQMEVEAMQKYPSGEVVGTLTWYLSQWGFCVQPEAVSKYIDLMDATLDNGGVYNSTELLEELQFPHWYESTGTWKYQLLRYLRRVDMEAMRNELHPSWQRCGHLRPPLELVELKAKGPVKFYPVDDGEGGGAVFTDNASAQEYLHLDEGRRMLRCTTTMELGARGIDLWLDGKTS